MKRFKWHKIEALQERLQNEIVAFAFRDCEHGWRSEVEKPDRETHPDADKYHGSKIFIKETRDGGETWTPVYVGDNVLERLRYQAATGRLWAIRVDYDPAKRQQRFAHALVVSDDGGHRWREYCALPHAMDGFEFIDDRRGYAWNVSIYATADAGEHWHELARMRDGTSDAHMEFVGADGTFTSATSPTRYSVSTPGKGSSGPSPCPTASSPGN